MRTNASHRLFTWEVARGGLHYLIPSSLRQPTIYSQGQHPSNPSKSATWKAMASKGASTGGSKSSKSASFKPPHTSTGGGQRRQQREPSQSEEDEQEVSQSQDDIPTIPPKLLTKLIHSFFEDDRTRMSKDANAAVGKYMETFVREAIARAEHEKTSSNSLGIDKFLEVSMRSCDLGKIVVLTKFLRLKISRNWRLNSYWIFRTCLLIDRGTTTRVSSWLLINHITSYNRNQSHEIHTAGCSWIRAR